jgi:hypothetical protein
MNWPPNTFLAATDSAMGMVRAVWPGNISGKRHVIAANWLGLPLRDGCCHIAIGDGSLGCVNHPAGSRNLFAEVAGALNENGVMALRCFLLPEEPECPNCLLRNMFVAPDSSFTLFRVRLQMAMQQNRRGGVAVSEVYRLWHALSLACFAAGHARAKSKIGIPARLPSP